MYEIRFDEKAIDFLNELPKDIGERIYNKIISAKENPFRLFIKLGGREDYRLRIGDYRVIADIDTKARLIEVTLVGHRRNVYKKS